MQDMLSPKTREGSQGGGPVADALSTVHEPGAVGGNLYDSPIGLIEAVRRDLQAKRKARQFPDDHEKWILVHLDALCKC